MEASVDQDVVTRSTISSPQAPERWSKRRLSGPSWYHQNRGEQDVAASSSEPPTPTSPTLSDCSMDSQTDLIPPTSGKLRSYSHRSSLQQSLLPSNSHQISSPMLNSSSIDATIRSSIPRLGIDTAVLPVRPTTQSTKSGSWPNRHHRCATLGEDEEKTSESTEPKSEFSDSDDEDEGERSRGKSFKRRLSGTFGHCFGGRKN